MKNVPMRFCGYSFHHNPSTLKIEYTDQNSELLSSGYDRRSARLGNASKHIIGEGELYGADCLLQYRELERLCDNGTVGILSLPHLPAMYACLKSLRMTAEPKENILGYRFEFVEEQRVSDRETIPEYYETLVAYESLWDVAYRYGVGIDTLVRLNPQIKDIDSLDEGERVRLC